MQKSVLLTFIFIYTIIFLITSTGCKKGDSSNLHPKQMLGKWYRQSSISHSTYNGVVRNDTLIYHMLHDTTFYGIYSGYYEFNANGTVQEHESDTEANYKWQIANGKLLMGSIYNINILTDSTLQIERFET